MPPVKRFQPGDRLHVQAQQIWLILVAFVCCVDNKSRRNKTISYGELAIAMGRESVQAGHFLGRQLGIIGHYCVENELPPLNVIVINQETGTPGNGVVLRPGRSVRDEQKEVFKENWFSIRVPTTGMFRKIWDDIGKQ